MICNKYNCSHPVRTRYQYNTRGCLFRRPALRSPSCPQTLCRKQRPQSDSKKKWKSSPQQPSHSNNKNGNERRPAAQAPPQINFRPQTRLHLKRTINHKDGGYMVIAYTIFIYMGSQKKMPPGEESEEGKAEAGSLPNKNKKD